MPDIFGINYNEVKPRPTYGELINFEEYSIRYSVEQLHVQETHQYLLISME